MDHGKWKKDLIGSVERGKWEIRAEETYLLVGFLFIFYISILLLNKNGAFNMIECLDFQSF